LQRSAPVSFEITAVNLDQKQPGFPVDVLPNYLQNLGVRYRIIEQNTYAVVKRVIAEGKTMCGLCSRLRRGALYRLPRKTASPRSRSGHHRDDIVETLFLNMFFGGKLKAMPPKLLSEDRRHIVIRPLAYVPEATDRPLCGGPRVSHHSLHAVRLAAKHAARHCEEHAARLGAGISRPHRSDILQHLQRRPARSSRTSSCSTSPASRDVAPHRGDERCG
jgi:hypothetical protein